MGVLVQASVPVIVAVAAPLTVRVAGAVGSRLLSPVSPDQSPATRGLSPGDSEVRDEMNSARGPGTHKANKSDVAGNGLQKVF